MVRPHALQLSPLALLFLLIPVTGFAQSGVNLSWSDCGAAGAAARIFACANNVAGPQLVASVVSGIDMPQVVSTECILQIMADAPTLPSWWLLGTGACGEPLPTLPRVRAWFGPQETSCPDAWGGTASGSLSFQPGFPSINGGVYRVVGSTPSPVNIQGATEYRLFNMVFTSARSSGPGSCAGCATPATIIFCQAKLVQTTGVGSISIYAPALRNYVSWQSLSGTPTPDACPLAVPAGTPTWGAIKSLYR